MEIKAERVADTQDHIAEDIATAMRPARADLSRRIPEDVLERLVYIVGSPRGGTTIIARSFSLSDRVFTFPAFTRFTRDVWKHRNKVDRRLLRRIFRLADFYHELRVLRSLDESMRGDYEREIQDAYATKHFGRLFKLYPRFYSLDPECTKNGAHALCWSDKANDVIGLFDIPRAMPQAKFIFIIRDPRATIASMQGQVLLTRGEKRLSHARASALISSAIYWRHMMQTLLRFARQYPDRVTFVRYEDYVNAPQETINGLLEFAGAGRMDDEALGRGLAQFTHGKKHEPGAVRYGIDRRPLERWRKMLNEEEIALVTSLTWRTGRKLKYDVDRSSVLPTLKALRHLKTRREQVALGLKFAYLELRERIVPYLKN